MLGRRSAETRERSSSSMARTAKSSGKTAMAMTRFHQRDNPGLETWVMISPRLIWQRESNPRPFSVWGLRLAQQTEREPNASPEGMPLRSRAQNVEKNISRVGTRRTAIGSSQSIVNKGLLMCWRWGDWISGRRRALHHFLQIRESNFTVPEIRELKQRPGSGDIPQISG